MNQSTRYAARKQAVPEGQENRVNWLYSADLDTMAVAISDATGIVQVDLGLGFRNPKLYRNELLAILDKADEIRRYLDDHPEAKDTPPSKKQQRAMEALTKTVLEAKEKETYVQALKDAGLKQADIDIAVVKRFGKI